MQRQAPQAHVRARAVDGDTGGEGEGEGEGDGEQAKGEWGGQEAQEVHGGRAGVGEEGARKEQKTEGGPNAQEVTIRVRGSPTPFDFTEEESAIARKKLGIGCDGGGSKSPMPRLE